MAASEFYSKCSKEGFRSGDDMILWVSVIILLQCCHREKELGGGEAVMVSLGFPTEKEIGRASCRERVSSPV